VIQPLTGAGTTTCASATGDGREMVEGQGQQQPVQGFVIRPGEGRAIKIPGVAEISTVKAGGADTAGTVSVHEEWKGPDDTGVPRHVHHHMDEMYYVLEGEMRFVLGEEELVAGPGTFVYIPHGTVHAWRPTGAGPVRQLLITIPGGFEGYLDEMQGLPTPQEAPEAWQDLNRRWDAEIVGPILDGA
jgi:mannose-6-phosphate isomerase-like protein (cupin superfamily)